MNDIKKIQDILTKKYEEEELDLESFDLTEEELASIDDFEDVYCLESEDE